MQNYRASQSEPLYEYVGIAADEPKLIAPLIVGDVVPGHKLVIDLSERQVIALGGVLQLRPLLLRHRHPQGPAQLHRGVGGKRCPHRHRSANRPDVAGAVLNGRPVNEACQAGVIDEVAGVLIAPLIVGDVVPGFSKSPPRLMCLVFPAVDM